MFGFCLFQEKSLRLWAFLLGVYWVSFVTYYVLWKSYTHVSDLRAGAKTSAVVKPEEFAVLVRDIPAAPPGQSMKDHVDSYFRALHPETFYKSMVVTDNKEVHNSYAPIINPYGSTCYGNTSPTLALLSFRPTKSGKRYKVTERNLLELKLCMQNLKLQGNQKITMLGYIGILRKFFYAPFLIPLIVISFIFAYVCKQRFYLAFFHTSLEVACQGTKEIPNMESIFAAYIPPCLSTEKLEDVDQFEDAHSHSLRTTSL
ncbi:hypothetical protein B296_00037744 [Ensete ventricosum]|uniref:Uncharacterized protein n=1 Tax=Ensete ventricosum TaxID=4639 RepID=A0A426ZUD2_ENSVE|nr:hypothetical protein B296_00037744 [Ensete ventricosum]